MGNADAEGDQLQLEADESDLQLFLEDSNEQLELLDQNIIKIEKEPDDDLLQEIFRAAHTLKGSSATIGHTQMAELTHAMEGVLDELRKNALAISTPVIDTLLESLDALRVLLDEVMTLQHSGVDFGPLTARLHALRDGDKSGESAAADADGAPGAGAGAARASTLVVDEALTEKIGELQGAGHNIVEVRVTLVPDCAMPAVQMFQCLVELNANGEVLLSSPTSEQIEGEQVESELHCLYATLAETDEVKAHLAPVMDIGSVEAEPYVGPDERKPGSAESDDSEGEGKRIIDLGPEARGKTAKEQLKVAAAKIHPQTKSVRIDVGRLDSLMNLTGELVIDRGRLTALTRRFVEAKVEPTLLESLSSTAAHLGLITTELQDQVMKSRMQPVANVFNRFPRMVRDLARKAGKEVDLQISGEDTELDRSVIEEIGDPLIHLLRNAVDHGLETPEERIAAGKPRVGVLRLSSGHEDNAIVIRVQDDGRGIDPAKIRSVAVEKGLLAEEAGERLSDQEAVELIWMPGFSTAEKVTDVSGRGVGTDIVKTNIENLNGSISVTSEVSVGSTFTVRVPLTLAVIQGLVLRVGETRLVLPLASVTETLSVRTKDLRNVHGGQAIQLRGDILPVVDLGKLLSVQVSEEVVEDQEGDGEKTEAGERDRFVVAVRTANEYAGFIVDELLGQQEVVIKSLGGMLRRVPGISGATLMGDEVALIADVPSLLRLHRDQQGVAAA